MQTTYRLKADQLSLDIIDAVKSTYHNREITITIEDVQDETDFLLSSDANRAHLLTAVEDLKSRRNLVEVNITDPSK